MFSIELACTNRTKFLSYLADHIKDNNNDIKNFEITIDNDEATILTPLFGKYNWTFDGDTFLIEYKEEGKPTGNEPSYFTRFIVYHSDIEKLKAFIKYGITYSKPINKRKIKIYVAKSRGYWENINSIYAQEMKNIFMDQTIKDSIVHHVDSFLSNKDKYIKYGRPYKLNFLFTGVPGSGKSSLVKALALHLKRSLYILSFTKQLTDETLIELASDMKENSILLLEDIDAFFQDRKALDINVSFSCLINILDGTLNSSNGCITILTANNPDRLDPALIRPGRVDRIINFDHPKRSDILEAFLDLTNKSDKFDEFYKSIKNMRMSMSSIIDFLFRYPENFMENIDELIDNTKLLNEISNDKSDKMYC